MATKAVYRPRAIPKSMDRSQFERVLGNAASVSLVIVGVLAVAMALAAGRVILAPLSMAIVIGLMFGPVADAMERRGIPSALSAGVVVIGFVAVLAGAASLFAGPLAEWVARGPLLWTKIQAQIATLKQPFDSLGTFQDQLKSLMGDDATMTVEVQDGGPMQNIALMAPSFAADVLLFLAGLYFFLATRHHIRISVLSLCFSRSMRWRTAHVFHDVELKVSRFLISATLINLGVGVATSAAMWALGLPTPLLWGALAGVLNFIPYIGQAVMLVILLTVGLATQPGILPAILPVLAYGAINLCADQIIFPHLVGRALTLNPFIIFVATAFWIWVWGPAGGFVAVPSLLVLQSMIMHIFPTTAALPEVVRRKIEARSATVTVTVKAEETDDEVVSTETPDPPAERKAAITGSA